MTLLLTLLAAAAPAAPPRLVFPVACRLGQDCVIQNYPDDRPGPGVRDAGCGERTYEGHDGTDIRVASMAAQRAGVAVLAAAAGTVLRVRDGVADMSIRARGAPSVAGAECGNGIVIGHAGGWETQYCHLARGSVAVRPGQAVAAGAAIARVGLSGKTEFPHLHLTVREDGQAVDPFAWGRPAGQCRGGRSLWADTPAYVRGGVLAAGFAAGPVTMDQVQAAGDRVEPRPARTAPLVAYAQAVGLEAGDVQHLVLAAGDGTVLADNRAAPLDRAKAQTVLFAGKQAPPGGWPAGPYRARYEVLRDGRPAIVREFRIAL